MEQSVCEGESCPLLPLRVGLFDSLKSYSGETLNPSELGCLLNYYKGFAGLFQVVDVFSAYIFENRSDFSSFKRFFNQVKILLPEGRLGDQSCVGPRR